MNSIEFKKIRKYNLLGMALCSAILVSVISILFSPEANQSALLLGDFPAFYSLGFIANSNEHMHLYDLQHQTDVQNRFWPELDGGVLIAVYPPSLALLISTLTILGTKYAHLVYTFLSITALSLSSLLMTKDSKLKVFIFGLLLCNPFILIGTVGGQNTAFSILIAYSGMLLLSKSINKKKTYL